MSIVHCRLSHSNRRHEHIEQSESTPYGLHPQPARTFVRFYAVRMGSRQMRETSVVPQGHGTAWQQRLAAPDGTFANRSAVGLVLETRDESGHAGDHGNKVRRRRLRARRRTWDKGKCPGQKKKTPPGGGVLVSFRKIPKRWFRRLARSQPRDPWDPAGHRTSLPGLRPAT
jgi:hypothetical protein